MRDKDAAPDVMGILLAGLLEVEAEAPPPSTRRHAESGVFRVDAAYSRGLGSERPPAIP